MILRHRRTLLTGAAPKTLLCAVLLAPTFALADIIVPDHDVDVLEDSGKAAPASTVGSAAAPTSAVAAPAAPATAVAPASTAPSTTPSSQAVNAVPTSAATAGMSRFEKDERLEALRYRNLWIGFAAIWLIIFAFIFRTWKRTQETGRELSDLRAKLDAFEARQGKGEA